MNTLTAHRAAAKANLVLGEPRLDEDHAELWRLFDLLDVAQGKTATLRALERLSTHATEHFGTEDADLVIMKDGNAKCHMDEHAAVLSALAEVHEHIGQSNDAPQTATQNAAIIRALLAELRRWLPEHVQAMDAGVAAYRTKNRFGGAPVVITKRGA